MMLSLILTYILAVPFKMKLESDVHLQEIFAGTMLISAIAAACA